MPPYSYPALLMMAQSQPVHVDQVGGTSATAKVLTYGMQVTASHLGANLHAKDGDSGTNQRITIKFSFMPYANNLAKDRREVLVRVFGQCALGRD